MRSPAHRRAALVGALALLVSPAAVRAQHEHPGAAPQSGPRLELHGFFNVDLAAARVSAAGADSTSIGYRLGQFDLFFNSALAPRVSFLAEMVVEASADGESELELERAYVRYAFSDRLRVSAGRTHSAVSDWYVRCHHGALLQPTIERPMPVRFEDDPEGGFLPAHVVGLELSGQQPLGDAALEWVANLSNGRTHSPDEVQIVGDENRDKQFGASVSLGAHLPFEWRAGGAWFHDRVPFALPDGAPMDQDIQSVHVLLRTAWLEEVGEYFRVSDFHREAQLRFVNHAWYTVVTAGAAALRPYAAVEGMRMDAADGFYAGRPDFDRFTFGLRYDRSESNAIKFEYRNARSADTRTNELLVQTAFTF